MNKTEIERKAASGIPLTNPTTESQAYYDQMKAKYSQPVQNTQTQPQQAQTTSGGGLPPEYWNMVSQQQAYDRQKQQQQQQQRQQWEGQLAAERGTMAQRNNQYMQNLQNRLSNMEQFQSDQARRRDEWRQGWNEQIQQQNTQQQQSAQDRYDQLTGNYQQLLDSLKQFQEQNPLDSINLDDFRTPETTIEDLAARYGFDYSRDYADRQASTEAEAIRNALRDVQRQNQSLRDQNLRGIESGVMNAADALDRNYFQQMLQQQQAQTNSGLNAGIAADQDLRLQMARQAEMSPIYRDANLGRMQENQRFTNEDLRLLESLGLVDQQELARADQLYNDRLQQGFQNAMGLDQARRGENLAMLQAALSQRGQNMDMTQFLQSLAQQGGQFNWQAGQQMDQDSWNRLMQQLGWDTQQQQFGDQMDWSQLSQIANMDQWNQQFGAGLDQQNWQRLLDQIGVGQWGQEYQQREGQFDWSRLMDQAGLQQQDWAQQFQEMQEQFRQQQQEWANQFNVGQATGNINGQDTLQKIAQQWNQMADTIGWTGQLPDFMGGGPSVQEQQRQFANNLAERQFNRPYEELTAYQKQQIDLQAGEQAQIIQSLQEQINSTTPSEGLNIFDLPATHFESVLYAYEDGNTQAKEWLKKQFPGIENLAKTSMSTDEIQAFLDSINPRTKTKEQAIAEIDAMYNNGQGIISAAERNERKALLENYYDNFISQQPDKIEKFIDAITPKQNPLFGVDQFQNIINWIGNLLRR